jgi:hypothetical protein
MPDESLKVLIKTTAGAPGGKPGVAALDRTSDAARRLQDIFESTKGDPGIAESVRGMAQGAGDARPAYGQRSQHPHEDLMQAVKDLDRRQMPAAMAAGDAAGKRATGPETGGRAREAKDELPAAPFAASEARLKAGDKYPPATDAAKAEAQNAAAAAKQPGAPGIYGGVEQVAVTVESGETAGTSQGPGQALTQQDRDASPVEDRVDPAIKALLAEVGKMQDRHLNGLQQAVDMIAGTAQTVDGLIGLMKAMAARQQRIEGDQGALVRQMVEWARSTQIP